MLPEASHWMSFQRNDSGRVGLDIFREIVLVTREAILVVAQSGSVGLVVITAPPGKVTGKVATMLSPAVGAL